MTKKVVARGDNNDDFPDLFLNGDETVSCFLTPTSIRTSLQDIMMHLQV